MDIREDFIDAMIAAGCGPAKPSEIIADDIRRRYQIAGDKKGKRNGSYQLKADAAGGVGWFRNFKEGVTHTWASKAQKKMTDAERRAWVRKREADKIERDKQIAKQHERAAKRAQALWLRSERGPHPYLERKKIKSLGSRVSHGALIIPAYKGGQISTLQFISATGEKRFLTGGDIKGAYGAVNSVNNFERIIITEGFATAATIHERLKIPVIVAFNTSNMLPVAEVIRSKYPESEILIAADNDQWTKRPDGTPWNPGIEAAEKAAKAIAGGYFYPDIPHDDHEKRTDFNDAPELIEPALKKITWPCKVKAPGAAMTGQGHANQKAQLPNVNEASALSAPAAADDMLDWRAQCITNAEGRLVKSSLKNIMLVLANDERVAGTFVYDEFHNTYMVAKQPPWHEGPFQVHELNDNDVTNCAAWIEQLNLAGDTAKVFKAICAVSDRNRINPARDHFESLVWDGKERLHNWLSYYLGAEDAPREYLSFIGRKWLTAAVKRVYEPGCKFDHVLVLEGAQGVGKSTALRELATFAGESYFTDQIQIADLANKDTIQKIQGSIIVELAELAGFSKKEDAEIKGWITVQVDHVRLPYARTPVKYARQFVLAATTNDQDYLKDPTGNRRYWPFKSNAVDIEAIQEDRQQLWAEAVELYKAGLYIGPTAEEMALAEEQQSYRRTIDSWEDSVLRAVDEINAMGDDLTGEKIMRNMGLSLKDMDRRAQLRVSSVLRANGFVSKPKRTGKRVVRCWVPESED